MKNCSSDKNILSSNMCALSWQHLWKTKWKASLPAPHPSAEAVNFECTLLNKTAATEETSNRSRWKLFQLFDADPLGWTPEMARPGSKMKVSSKCKMDFRKLLVGSTGNEDSIWQCHENGQSSSGWSVQALFFLSFFFFFTFLNLICAFFWKKVDPQASETKKRGHSYMPDIHFNSKLALTTTCSLRVLPNIFTRQYTLHILT